MGIAPVAVHSEADRGALHVRLADESHLLGPGPSRESYLRIDRVIEAARALRGRGRFIPGTASSPRTPSFAQACVSAGLVFIGPTSETMVLLGEKTSARRAAVAAGLPVVPGTLEPLADDAAIAREATAIGFPVMLKAAAGGGGKGMRLVASPAELDRRHRPGAQRSQDRVRRRPRLRGEGHPEAAPHRDPGAGRHPRPRRPPLRARVLHPAAAPEGDRGEPLALRHPGAARAHGRPRRGPRPAHRVRQCRHPRVPGGRERRSLFPGDEHPAPGRASGHGDGHGPGHRQAADPHRGGRAPSFPTRRPPAAGARHRMPGLRRRPRPGFPAQPRTATRLAGPGGTRNPRRHRRHRRVRRSHRLRPAALEAHRPRPGPRRGHRADGRGPWPSTGSWASAPLSRSSRASSATRPSGKGDFDTSFLATLADAPKSRARRETAAIAAAIRALRDQQRHVPASGAAPSSWWQAGVREGHRGRA